MVRLILVFFKLKLGILKFVFFKQTRMWLMAGNNGRFCLHIFNNLATYDSHGNNIALRVYYFIKVECRNKNKAIKTKNLEKVRITVSASTFNCLKNDN